MTTNDFSGDVIDREPGESDNSLISRRAAFVEHVQATRSEMAGRVFLHGIDPTFYDDVKLGEVDLPPLRPEDSDPGSPPYPA